MKILIFDSFSLYSPHFPFTLGISSCSPWASPCPRRSPLPRRRCRPWARPWPRRCRRSPVSLRCPGRGEKVETTWDNHKLVGISLPLLENVYIYIYIHIYIVFPARNLHLSFIRDFPLLCLTTVQYTESWWSDRIWIFQYILAKIGNSFWYSICFTVIIYIYIYI